MDSLPLEQEMVKSKMVIFENRFTHLNKSLGKKVPYPIWRPSSSWLFVPVWTICPVNLAKSLKKAGLGDLREVNKVMKKVNEKESRVLIKRIGDKKDLCLIDV